MCQARFWVQVISELRRGVKLKKVEASLGSRAFSSGQESRPDYKMTPYEILMDDIRERRYHLRKTPPTPSRKDAHALILEFIRSRPPLKKARLVFQNLWNVCRLRQKIVICYALFTAGLGETITTITERVHSERIAHGEH